MNLKYKKLHEYFKKTYLINLDRRVDRLESVTKRCDELGIVFEKVSAIDGKTEKIDIINPSYYWSSSAAALSKTFLNKIIEARDNSIESILFLEDDVEFHPNIHEVLDMYMKDIPKDWEMIYFGGNHNIETTPMSNHKHIHICNKTYTTHCYAIHNSVYDIIIKELSIFDNPVDLKFGTVIHPRGKSYVFRPHLAYQIEDYSDIIDKNVNYTFLKR